MLGHFPFVEQNLVFSVLVRVRVLLIDHGHDVMFAVGVVRGCLVGVVVTASLDALRFVERRHHGSSVVEIVEGSMLEFAFLTFLGHESRPVLLVV